MRRFALVLAVAAVALASSSWCLADDQQIAQAIVEKLREHQQQGQLKGFDIDLKVEDGKVTMTGNVSHEGQHQIAIDSARFVPGVKLVINDLKIRGEVADHPAQQHSLPGGLVQPGAKPSIHQTVSPTTTLVSNGPIADAQPPIGSAQHLAQAQAQAEQLAGLPTPASNKPEAELTLSNFSQPSTRSVLKLGQLVETAEEALPVIATDAQSGAVAQADLVETQPLNERELAQAQQLAVQQMAAQQFAMQQYAAQQWAMQQQMGQGRAYAMPIAHANSTLPGSPARGQMPIQLVQAQQLQAQQMQMMQAQQMAPAPQFIQGTGGGVQPARYDHPNMPGYAWPGYASHPNYAAVQYPKQYSAHAWPYIGPFYPYPQVPLGWRKVTLSWDDGWWFLDFKDRGYGPYVTR